MLDDALPCLATLPSVDVPDAQAGPVLVRPFGVPIAAADAPAATGVRSGGDA